MRKNALMLTVAIAAWLAPGPGCGERRKAAVAPPDAEAEYWRQEYRRRRPEPPLEYSVFPKPPRDNLFREFDEGRFRGLDSQPPLPALPGDGLSHSGGASAIPAVPPPPPPPSPLTPTPPPPVAPGLGEIRAGTRYYPVDQLVYGGGHPDLDRGEEYRLMSRDVITVAVRDHPEFSATMEIQPDGTVTLPNTPDIVRLRGLVAGEAAGEIANALRPYVKGEPRVLLQTNRARGGYYYVFGEVRQPGRFPLGLEPVTASAALLAANWELNPGKTGEEGMTPAFPAAVPGGRYSAPAEADLSRVQLITPHRSRPVRTVHDVRAALLGATGDDPVLKPGQILVVPSVIEAKNEQWGLEAPLAPGRGFSGADGGDRLPSIAGGGRASPPAEPKQDEAERNMEINAAMTQSPGAAVMEVPDDGLPPRFGETPARKDTRLPGW